MNKNIIRYLNNHLAGSSVALLLIQKLIDRHDVPEARDFLHYLKKQVEADQSLLEELLRKIGQTPSVFLKMAGGVTARIVVFKLTFEKIKPGNLGLLEALEVLAVGVQGKRLLWVTLREVSEGFQAWSGVDFEELECQAIQQRDKIEFLRVQAAGNVLTLTS